MADEKEYVNGSYEGSDVKFARVYRGYRFTDAEVDSLLAGDSVNIDLISSSGNPYTIKTSLGNDSFINDQGKEITYFGVVNRGFVEREGVPRKFCGYLYSEDEITALEAGEEIFVKGYESKAGKPFDAYTKYDFKDGADRKSIILRFENKK